MLELIDNGEGDGRIKVEGLQTLKVGLGGLRVSIESATGNTITTHKCTITQ